MHLRSTNGSALRYTRTDDSVNIAYRDDGPRDAQPILFCSLGTAALSIWDSVTAALSDHARVIRYDRRGDGDSDAGTRESHSFSRYARDALEVLDACDCRRAVVCGMAFGARVAYRLAMDGPERVKGLILFDATGGPPAPEAIRKKGSEDAAQARRKAGIADYPVDKAWFHRREPHAAGFLINALKDLPLWAEGFDKIAVPTLVACGEFDPNYPAAQRVAAEIPGAEFQSMPLTGHASILDRPDLVLNLIDSFLARVE